MNDMNAIEKMHEAERVMGAGREWLERVKIDARLTRKHGVAAEALDALITSLKGLRQVRGTFSDAKYARILGLCDIAYERAMAAEAAMKAADGAVTVESDITPGAFRPGRA